MFCHVVSLQERCTQARVPTKMSPPLPQGVQMLKFFNLAVGMHVPLNLKLTPEK